MKFEPQFEEIHSIGLIADEETCVGFLLAGIGECDSSGRTNFLVVRKDTTVKDIENFFIYLYHRKDIGIILITNEIAKQIPKTITNIVKQILPVVLNIPSRNLTNNDEEK